MKRGSFQYFRDKVRILKCKDLAGYVTYEVQIRTWFGWTVLKEHVITIHHARNLADEWAVRKSHKYNSKIISKTEVD